MGWWGVVGCFSLLHSLSFWMLLFSGNSRVFRESLALSVSDCQEANQRAGGSDTLFTTEEQSRVPGKHQNESLALPRPPLRALSGVPGAGKDAPRSGGAGWASGGGLSEFSAARL